ncbi:ankyrin repeat-containing domain protein [Jimgerdemannia flammicorona]|uniref:Ankyrin repeat-containing domain protein n=1 Tax=Jimgerdemannia flammicorona TaxID=994334 RepID=A0A433QZ08_9FUNG|nr:ankyrin repeat-containing domain protein [Jimgerdemannia flammicorona]
MFTRKYTNGDENLDQWLLTGKRKEMAEQKDDANMDFDENFSVTYTTGIYRKDFWEKPNSRSGLVKGDPIEIVSFLMALKDIHIDVMDGYDFFLRPHPCSHSNSGEHHCITPEDSVHSPALRIFLTMALKLMQKTWIGINTYSTSFGIVQQNTPLQIALIYDHVDYSVMLANKNAEVLRDLVRYNGDSLSTFNFSLSKSFMSLSYLIMEKGVSLIGKFHLALLLISKAEEFMLQQLNSNGQNLFHVLGDFRPFDKYPQLTFNVSRSIWDEYIAETFEILLANGLDYSLVDNFGRTPLHYAAKFGHEILVTLLLGRTVAVNLVDEDGHTPLWYAVMANSTPSFQILLNHLPDVNLGDMEKHPSILFNAVKARNLSMVQTLLEVGARWDADAQNDRQNSVLKAVVDNSYDILQALIKAGADINEASVFTFAKEMCGAKQHQMHPIFLATTSSTREIFEVVFCVSYNDLAAH